MVQTYLGTTLLCSHSVECAEGHSLETRRYDFFRHVRVLQGRYKVNKCHTFQRDLSRFGDINP